MIAKQKLITLPYQIKQLHFAVNCQYVTKEDKSWVKLFSERHPDAPISEYVLMSNYFRLKDALAIYLNSFAHQQKDVFTCQNIYTDEYTQHVVGLIHKHVKQLHESAAKYLPENDPFHGCISDLYLAADHAVAFFNAVLNGKSVNWVTFEIQD